MDTLKVNTIYPAYMGEVNKFGIGVPCVFVRLAGCNIRCYKKTLGVLCDTPEALEMHSGKDMSAEDIFGEVKKYDAKIVCLTGGEPLMQNVSGLLSILTENGLSVVVETNGTRRVALYRMPGVSFVVDYKSKSSGCEELMLNQYKGLTEDDFLKFVLYDRADYEYFKAFVLCKVCGFTEAKIAVGLFWGAKIGYQELISWLIADEIYDRVYLNMQTHKMAVLHDEKIGELQKLFIPKEL